MLAYLGVLRAGAAMVPADPGSTASELAHLIGDSGAVAAWADAEPLEHLPDRDLRFAGALGGLRAAEGEPLAPASASDDLAMVAYTSGTTGPPKGVALSHGNVLASLRAVMGAWRWRRDDVLVHGLPLSHQHGLSGVQIGLLAGVARGAARALRARAAVRRGAARGRAPWSSRCRRCTSACWAGRASRARTWAPCACGCRDRPRSRRASPRGCRSASASCRSSATARPRPGSASPTSTTGRAGPARSGCRCRASSSRSPTTARSSCAGRRCSPRYWEQPDTTADAFTGDGWFRTGDLGRLDDGDLAITGRIKELIISGGLNVSPREVELALEEHPSVSRAAVVGVPSERWGEQVVAFVVPEGATSTRTRSSATSASG